MENRNETRNGMEKWSLPVKMKQKENVKRKLEKTKYKMQDLEKKVMQAVGKGGAHPLI